MHFIEFFVVETKRFVGRFVNVILTRQTCGQRSSRAAESKRRALGNYFSEQICYMFLISNWDSDVCTFWILAKREPLRNVKFRFFLRAKHVFSRKSPLRRSGSIFCKCTSTFATVAPMCMCLCMCALLLLQPLPPSSPLPLLLLLPLPLTTSLLAMLMHG